MVKSKVESKNFERARKKEEIILEQEKEQNTQYYEVEKIIDVKVIDGQKKYLVKWMNFSSNFNTWEPKDSFSDLQHLQKFQSNFQKIQNLEESSSQQHESNSSKNAQEKPMKKKLFDSTKIEFFLKQNIQELNRNQIIKGKDEFKEIIQVQKEIKCTSQKVEDENLQNRMDEEKYSSQSSDPFEINDDSNKTHQNQLKSKSKILKKRRRRAFLKRNGLDQRNIVVNVEKDRQKRNKIRCKENLIQLDYDRKSVEFSEKSNAHDEKVYYEVLEAEQAVGKQILYQFKEANQNMFRIELNNKEKISLTQQLAKVFFPRLIIDHYQKIIQRFAYSNYD